MGYAGLRAEVGALDRHTVSAVRGFALLGWVALPTLSYGAVHVLLVEAFDSGSKMEAATGAQVRPDAVIGTPKAAAGPVADKRAQLGAGQLPGVVLRDGSRAGEDPGGDDVQQELTGAVCRASAVHVLSVIAMVTGRRGWPGTGSSVS